MEPTEERFPVRQISPRHRGHRLRPHRLRRRSDRRRVRGHRRRRRNRRRPCDHFGSRCAGLAACPVRDRRAYPRRRRVEHLTDNIAGLEVTLSPPEHLRTLDEVSAPTLNYPAPMHGEQRAMLQFAGATVDGESSTVYPPLLQSDVRIRPGEVRTARSTPSSPAISAEPRES